LERDYNTIFSIYGANYPSLKFDSVYTTKTSLTSGLGGQYLMLTDTANPKLTWLSSTNIGINFPDTASTISAELEVIGTTKTTNLSATTISGGTSTINGTKGTVTTNGSSTTAFINFSGSGTVGGTGYTDFIRVTNTSVGVTNPNKTFRLNNTGNLEIIDSTYSNTIFTLTDSGEVIILGKLKSTINYSQVGGGASITLTATSSPQTILSTTITTSGNPVRICAYGDAENTGAGYWSKLQFWRDSTQIGAIVHTEGSNGSENTPFGMNYIDNPVAGTYTYYLKANEISGGSIKFGESTAPTLNVQEL
jgi:hypothetical protein